MKDYSHLKGKDLKVYSFDKDEIVDGFVADIDPNVGITIKSTGTEKDLYCLNMSTSGLEGRDKFNFQVAQIESGIITRSDIKRYEQSFGQGSRLFNTSCAFE